MNRRNRDMQRVGFGKLWYPAFRNQLFRKGLYLLINYQFGDSL